MNQRKISDLTRSCDPDDVNGSCSQYFGRLMTPSEVAQGTINRPTEVRRITAGQWALCGDVSHEMFAHIREAPKSHIPMRLSGFSSSGGATYCAITLQSERYQCRFLLPLYDSSFRSFIEAMTKSEHLTLSLGKNESDEALLFRSPLKPKEYTPLLAMSCETTLEDQLESLRELPTMQAIMGNPLQIPSLLPGYSVQHVSMSLLLPSILQDCYKAALAKVVGV